MIKRPRLTRWDAIWAAGCVALFFAIGLVAGTPFYGIVGPLSSGVVLLLCIADWRAKGHDWLATLSWTVPLGGLWIAGQWLIEGPKGLVFWLGGMPIVVMLVSTRAATWWYEVVLRRPFRI